MNHDKMFNVLKLCSVFISTDMKIHIDHLIGGFAALTVYRNYFVHKATGVGNIAGKCGARIQFMNTKKARLGIHSKVIETEFVESVTTSINQFRAYAKRISTEVLSQTSPELQPDFPNFNHEDRPKIPEQLNQERGYFVLIEEQG